MLSGENQSPFNFNSAFSRSERQLLNLARALVVNYELLIIHKPISGLGTGKARQVIDNLQEFVEHRGAVLDPEAYPLRRRLSI